MTDINVLKAIESVQVRNAKAVVEYTKKTRNITNDLLKRVDKLERLVLQKDSEIKDLNLQIAILNGNINRLSK